MKCSVGHSWTPSVHGKANDPDPEAVHGNGDGDARQQDQNTLPDGSIEQICSQDAQAEKRKQIAQPTARLDDLELVIAHIDQITIEVDWNSERSNEEDA